MIHCLIIDDNPIATTTLNHLAKSVQDLEVGGIFHTAMDAFNHLQKNNVDLLFLDIEMPGMSGLELTKSFSDNGPLIIFTTSKTDYAAEAFELNVVDYLVKPIMVNRFLQALQKARLILEKPTQISENIDDSNLFVRDVNIIRKLPIDDILFAEAMGDYVKFHTKEKVFAIHGTLKSAEEKLPPNKFIRVHRSYILAINKVDSFQDGGAIVGDKFIPIAESYRKSLNSKLNIF